VVHEAASSLVQLSCPKEKNYILLMAKSSSKYLQKTLTFTGHVLTAATLYAQPCRPSNAILQFYFKKFINVFGNNNFYNSKKKVTEFGNVLSLKYYYCSILVRTVPKTYSETLILYFLRENLK
jgi:hypothetical protein